MVPVEVGILGAGNIGRAVARHLAKSGYRVQLANRRGPASLKSFTDELGSNAKASTVGEVARLQLVVVAIPWTDLSEAMGALPDWSGRVVIDANNHIIGFAGGQLQLADLRGKTSSEVFVEMVPGAKVVKALNTLAAEVLAENPRSANGRRVMFLSGDDAGAKKMVHELLDAVGFFPIDLGNLAVGGRLQQAGGPLSGANLLRIE